MHEICALTQATRTRAAIYSLRDVPCIRHYSHYHEENTLWRCALGCSESSVASATMLLILTQSLNPGRGEAQLLWAVGSLCWQACSSVRSLSPEPFEKTDTQPPNTHVSSLTSEQFKLQELCVSGTKRNWLLQCGSVLLNYQCSMTFRWVSGMQEDVSLPAGHPPCWCSICRAPGSPLGVCREGTPWNYPLSIQRKGNTFSKKPFLAIRGDLRHWAGSFLNNSLTLQACFTEAITSNGPGVPSHFTGQSFH